VAERKILLTLGETGGAERLRKSRLYALGDTRMSDFTAASATAKVSRFGCRRGSRSSRNSASASCFGCLACRATAVRVLLRPLRLSRLAALATAATAKTTRATPFVNCPSDTPPLRGGVSEGQKSPKNENPAGPKDTHPLKNRRDFEGRKRVARGSQPRSAASSVVEAAGAAVRLIEWSPGL
jgi:hypothetical protein